jgi:hypothetical protein
LARLPRADEHQAVDRLNTRERLLRRTAVELDENGAEPAESPIAVSKIITPATITGSDGLTPYRNPKGKCATAALMMVNPRSSSTWKRPQVFGADVVDQLHAGLARLLDLVIVSVPRRTSQSKLSSTVARGCAERVVTYRQTAVATLPDESVAVTTACPLPTWKCLT